MFRDIHALIFDFDGTLVDASEPICRSFNAALERFGVTPMDEPRIRALIGRPLREMFPAAVPNITPADIETLIGYYREVFTPIACELSNPMPGLHAMINHFHPHTKLAIATSRISDGAYRILESMALLDRFEIIVGLQDVTHAKPHPEPVLKALAHVGVAPRHALMIGDVPDDMRAGKSAGTGTVGMASELHNDAVLREAGADTTIRSLDALIDLIL